MRQRTTRDAGPRAAWRRLVAVGLIVAGLGAVSCGDDPTPAGDPESGVARSDDAPGDQPAAGHAPPRLVILVSIDTLRADHLGTYGYGRFTSPMIDTFAAEGTVFEDASSAAPWTLPSHATMLTGLYPRSHEVVTFATSLDAARPTLPAMLAGAGYRSAAVVSARWLKRDNYRLTKDFDDYHYVSITPWRRSPSTMVTDQAIEWLRASGDQKLFLMLHYFDVHGDYASEPEYEAMFTKPYDGPANGTSWQLLMSYLEPEYIEMCRVHFDPIKCAFGKGEGVRMVDEEFERIAFDDRDIAHLIDLYDAGIRQMDAELGRFIAYLRKNDYLDDALVIVTSDHGEEFKEHGRLDHFLSTHQEVLHVPLIMRGPGVPSGLRVSAPVSLVDLVPTVLDLAGVTPKPGLEGLSLRPLMQGADDQPYRSRAIFGEAPGGLTYEDIIPGVFPVIQSIRRDHWKLVYDSKQDRHALYDLSRDPHETTDLSAEKPAIAAQLAEEMGRRYEGFKPGALPNATVELSDEEIEELRALGYVP